MHVCVCVYVFMYTCVYTCVYLCLYVDSMLVAQMLTGLSKVTEILLDLNPVVTIIAHNCITLTPCRVPKSVFFTYVFICFILTTTLSLSHFADGETKHREGR